MTTTIPSKIIITVKTTDEEAMNRFLEKYFVDFEMGAGKYIRIRVDNILSHWHIINFEIPFEKLLWFIANMEMDMNKLAEHPPMITFEMQLEIG